MSTSEFQALLELLTISAAERCMAGLMLLLVTAAIFDYRSHRIPNWLVLSGAVVGVLYNGLLFPDYGIGFMSAFEGLGLGLILLLPLYLLRAMGAGDVKLMAMVGAFLGPQDVFFAMLASAVAGGVMSILYVLAKGTAARMFANLVAVFQLSFMSVVGGMKPDLQIDASTSAGKLPYGVAIAMGTSSYLVLHQLGMLSFI